MSRHRAIPSPRPALRMRAAWPLPAALLATLLGACSDGQQAQPARFVPPAPAVAELHGPLRAHYNLLPTQAMGEAVARQYGIERRAGSALLMVALREPLAGGDERPATGTVQAWAQDMSGSRHAVALRQVATGEYVDHIGIVAAGPRDVVRIEVSVQAAGRTQRFEFQRAF